MDDFRKEVLKLSAPRKMIVTNSLGAYDAYKWLRKNKWLNVGPVTEHNYYAILRGVNNELKQKFLSTGYIKFPHNMGELMLRKWAAKIYMEKGKLKTNLPIDWDTTLTLWKEDKEAYKNKLLIRREEKYIYKVIYNKYNANYVNKIFYGFKVNRFLKVALKEAINKGKIDAYLLCGKN